MQISACAFATNLPQLTIFNLSTSSSCHHYLLQSRGLSFILFQASFSAAEILVPIFYNNGTNVEAEKYRILFEELVKQFGAVSSEDNNVINGYWINPQDNKAYADKNKVYWLIVPDTEENRQYFANLQNKLESLFDQESILIYFTPVLNLLSD